jgi:hypothetical protein
MDPPPSRIYLHVLETKINMFELVVGELDMILGRIDEDFDFEQAVFDAFTNTEDDSAFTRRMDQIGDSLAAARGSYLQDRLSRVRGAQICSSNSTSTTRWMFNPVVDVRVSRWTGAPDNRASSAVCAAGAKLTLRAATKTSMAWSCASIRDGNSDTQTTDSGAPKMPSAGT